ncbi:MAG TPA: hypothetical protein VNN55_10980 [bacterium]|nr:hypothetical protein [bacterium]
MRLLRNIPLKILAIAFAMVLWFHVATNQRYDLAIRYNLSYVNIPAHLTMSEAPVGSVSVLLRGTGKALLRLKWGECRWPLDLSRGHVGTQPIPLQRENVPLYGIKDLEVLELLDHDTITVTLDSLATKTVPIRSAVEVKTDEGFVCARPPQLTPDSTALTGPRSALAEIAEVWTQPQVINNARDPIERLLAVLPPPGHGITSAVSEVRYYQKIEPYLTRAFEAVPVRLDGFDHPEAAVPEPTHVRVEVAGPQSAVVQLAPSAIAVVCDRLREEEDRLILRAVASVPDPLRVLKVSPDSVTVDRRGNQRADSGD